MVAQDSQDGGSVEMIQKIRLEKSQLREQIRIKRRAQTLNNAKIIFQDDAISNLINHPKLKSAQKIGVFLPTDTEPDVNQVSTKLRAKGLKTFIPRVDGELLNWGEYSGRNQELQIKGKFAEPIEIVTPQPEFDVIIAPALAVDIYGNRLGQGGAFYDRVLKVSKAFKVAVVFEDEFLQNKIPTEEHDQKVDAVLTPNKFLELK